MNKNNIRHFIVTTGRSGSSLLASILVDAGADFGLPAVSDWSENRGAYEHPDINYVSRQFRRAEYLRGKRRSSLFAKYLFDARRSLGKRKAKQVLRKIDYAKSDNLDLWIWHLIKMGYHPRIIVSFRDFTAIARSLYILRGMNYDQIVENYRRIYENSLLMLDAFGGCVISFEELIDVEETAWADALSLSTSFSTDSLIYYRNKRLKKRESFYNSINLKVLDSDPQISIVEDRLRKLIGEFIPPSFQIQRKSSLPPVK